MLALEIVLFIAAYTGLTVALVFGMLCYKRNIESKETIALIISLLLQVIAISVAPLLEKAGYTLIADIAIISCMMLVGVTTFLNALKEQNHKLPATYKYMYTGLAIVILITIVSMRLLGSVQVMQWPAVVFLIFSVLVAMAITRTGVLRIPASRNVKRGGLLAIAISIVVPVYLILQFGFSSPGTGSSIGFLLPAVFTLMAAHKISEDINRLAIFTHSKDSIQKDFLSYGLTGREIEVARLLAQGHSYQAIAEQLFISIPTVKTHTGNIYRKCNVRSKFELIKLVNG